MERPAAQYFSDPDTGRDRYKFDFVYPKGTIMAWYERVGEEWQMMIDMPSSEVLNKLDVTPF